MKSDLKPRHKLGTGIAEQKILVQIKKVEYSNSIRMTSLNNRSLLGPKETYRKFFS